MKKNIDKLLGLPALITAAVLWGTMGLFRRYIMLPSGMLAFARGVLGALFLLLLYLVRRVHPDFAAIRKNGWKLLLSGLFLGLNWICLFEAYRYSISVAVVCYYMAPVFVTLVSPLLLKERLTVKKVICIVVAFAGATMVSIGGQGLQGAQFQCVIFALIAAVFYAGVTVTTKMMHELPAVDCTVSQLAVAAVFLLPYTLIFERNAEMSFDPISIIFLIIVGILHTGGAFGLYFAAVGRLPAQTAALCSYIDPVVAILLSAVWFREPMGVWGVIGTVLVIGAALVGELDLSRRRKRGEDH